MSTGGPRHSAEGHGSGAPRGGGPQWGCAAGPGCALQHLGRRLVAMVRHPFIYEINTWVWLDELSARQGKELGLAGVPASEWDAIAALGFDAVWLMGVWERS